MGLTTALKASRLLEQNIDALLRARGQRRTDLAKYCRRTDGWLSKILSDDETAKRGLPLKYLDRISDFFGIATYQLFQPGISPLTERRSRRDRRSGHDRRISQAVLSQKPGDVDLVDVARALSRPGREKAIAAIADILNDELRGPRTTKSDPGPRDRTDERFSSTGVQKMKPTRKGAPPIDDERT